MDCESLADLSLREVFWVTRAKENLSFRVGRRFQPGAAGQRRRDALIPLQSPASRRDDPLARRHIVARGQVAGREVAMACLTHNLEWSARSSGEWYRCRWQIEGCFKPIKQTWPRADGLGPSANAVRWQVWPALLVDLRLRDLALLSNWSHSFSQRFTLIRAALWKQWDALSLLRHHGPAAGQFRYLARPAQAYLPGMG